MGEDGMGQAPQSRQRARLRLWSVWCRGRGIEGQWWGDGVWCRGMELESRRVVFCCRWCGWWMADGGWEWEWKTADGLHRGSRMSWVELVVHGRANHKDGPCSAACLPRLSRSCPSSQGFLLPEMNLGNAAAGAGKWGHRLEVLALVCKHCLFTVFFLFSRSPRQRHQQHSNINTIHTLQWLHFIKVAYHCQSTNHPAKKKRKHHQPKPNQAAAFS